MNPHSQPPFTLRIRTEQDQDIDWMVQPDEITFRQALEVISRIYPDQTATAFQYIDEDGEKITVRSDEELKAMFELHFSVLSEEDLTRGLYPPLVIYPRVGKTPKDRNIHALKIKTANTSSLQKAPLPQLPAQRASSQSLPQAGIQPPKFTSSNLGSQPPGAGNQSRAENIKDILTLGITTGADLQQIGHIGSGNGGQVYKAFHTTTQRLMAVKVIQLDIDLEAQKKILSELEILYKCHSPAIIGFYGAFFIENRISICTEYMDGGSLDRYGRMPEEILGRVAVCIIQGLVYMWSLKILHRDIKPSNILVNTSGDVKLCDFGVSTQLVASIAKTYVGTNAYMAPERIKAEHYGGPSEIWSLGVTLFELATGKFPYKKVSKGSQVTLLPPMEILNAILEGTPPTLPESEFSPELVNLVFGCMQKRPEQRITHQQLLVHPFIQKYATDDKSTQVLSQWITSHLQRIQSAVS